MTIDIELIPVSPDTDLFQCAILRIGTFRILLDCGWIESLDADMYAALPVGLFAQIDLVLLSHYSLSHCGALPFLINRGSKKKSSNQPSVRILATEAVRRMGELTLASLHEDVDKVKDVTVSDGTYTMGIEDIVTSFAGVRPVQFNERVDVAPGISVTAQPAGRLMGGAYWIITVGSQRIVYAVDYSLVAGRSVGGLAVGPAAKATVLVTDGSKLVPGDDVASRQSRGKSASTAVPEETLISAMKSTLRSGGSVLLPVDSNGRVLELLLAIEAAFAADAALQIYPVVFLSPLGDVVLDQVKTRMEWMNKAVLTEFEQSVNFSAHPFLLNHVKLCSSVTDFNDEYMTGVLGRKPKVVLATSATLDFGDSREIFCRFASDVNNAVLFTQLTGLTPGCLAERVIKDAAASTNPGVYKEQQFIKSPYPDEQLRQIYREGLEREANEDEVRRRRQREKWQSSNVQAPSSAAAVPVDLIRTGQAAGFELEGGEGSFFRPQLFIARTVSSGAVLKPQRVVSDYGEQLNSLEVDTWRAHAEMAELGAAREATAQAAMGGRVKTERGVKGELYGTDGQMIKGDHPDDDFSRIKGELGGGTAVGAAADSFDWRRDLQVRFGEPMRVEVRERMIKVACKIKLISRLEGHAASVHRREFLAAVQPIHLVMLPTRNLHDLQVVSMMCERKFYPTQEDIVPGIGDEDRGSLPTPSSISFSLSGEKKWLSIDPSAAGALEFKTLARSSVRVSKLDRTAIVGPMDPFPELIQVPSGDFVDYVVAPVGEASVKRQRTDSSLLLSTEPFRLGHFARAVKEALKDATVEFVSTERSGRALSVSHDGMEVIVTAARQVGADCPVIEIIGTPSPCFYKVRQALYAASTCL